MLSANFPGIQRKIWASLRQGNQCPLPIGRPEGGYGSKASWGLEILCQAGDVLTWQMSTIPLRVVFSPKWWDGMWCIMKTAVVPKMYKTCSFILLGCPPSISHIFNTVIFPHRVSLFYFSIRHVIQVELIPSVVWEPHLWLCDPSLVNQKTTSLLTTVITEYPRMLAEIGRELCSCNKNDGKQRSKAEGLACCPRTCLRMQTTLRNKTESSQYHCWCCFSICACTLPDVAQFWPLQLCEPIKLLEVSFLSPGMLFLI